MSVNVVPLCNAVRKKHFLIYQLLELACQIRHFWGSIKIIKEPSGKKKEILSSLSLFHGVMNPPSCWRRGELSGGAKACLTVWNSFFISWIIF